MLLGAHAASVSGACVRGLGPFLSSNRGGCLQLGDGAAPPEKGREEAFDICRSFLNSSSPFEGFHVPLA